MVSCNEPDAERRPFFRIFNGIFIPGGHFSPRPDVYKRQPQDSSGADSSSENSSGNESSQEESSVPDPSGEESSTEESSPPPDDSSEPEESGSDDPEEGEPSVQPGPYPDDWAYVDTPWDQISDEACAGLNTPRDHAPLRSNSYYFSNWNIYYAAGFGMPNCTAYALSLIHIFRRHRMQ